MRLMATRKWLVLAACLTGTSFQLSNCRDELGLFGVRTAFSSVFLPANQVVVFFFDLLASVFPGGLVSTFLGI